MSPRRSWFLVVLVLALVACGSHRQKLKTALVTVNGVRDAAIAWDAKHQDKLIDKAKQRKLTQAEVTAELDVYFKARAPVLDMFEEVYLFIAHAALEDDDTSFMAAMKAVGYLIEAVTNFQKLHEGAMRTVKYLLVASLQHEGSP